MNSLLMCFAEMAGNFDWTLEDVAKSIVCMLMSGPFLTGYTQVPFHACGVGPLGFNYIDI
jgi:hypothetical protein